MNERIKEIYIQADEQARQNACTKNNTLRPQNNTVWNEFVPLFAELIIRECAEIARHNVSNISSFSDAEWVEEKVKDHFGVE